MTEAGGRGSESGPRSLVTISLDDIWNLRTDYEDVSVPQLGGKDVRVYALTGTARAYLLGEMGDLAGLAKVDDADTATVRRLLEFQGRVVAASMGYAMDEWDRLGTVLGSEAIELLYVRAAHLSGLGPNEQAAEKRRLRTKRNAASGTD